jgi:hypothetical protein
MIESNSLEVGSGDLTRALLSLRSVATTIECSRGLVLTALVSAALLVRTFGLGTTGFSEDEVNKLRAVEAYSRSDFSANAEHPMLMKLAGWASVAAARWWNRHDRLASVGTISSEAALRLPNALVGGATTAVVFLLAEALFDTATGAWAALFWSLDVNAAAINRIGKEDTFLVFFLLLAAYWFERGKRSSALTAVERDRWFGRSGMAFGLMLASKYMPQYFGLHALFNIAADRNPADDVPDKRWPFFALMGAVFLVANFAVALPSTWSYVLGYARGETLRHSGYTFAHHLYANGIEASPAGLPPWFYLAFLATKVPLVVLAAAAVGIAWVCRHPSHRGATFVRVFLVFTLLPYSFVASKFIRYMLPVLAVIDMAAAVGVARTMRRLSNANAGVLGDLAPALVGSSLVLLLAVHNVNAAPYPSLAQNAIGAHLDEPGALFPDDEFYDAGIREAVAAIVRVAAPGAVVCGDATAVVAEYLARYGRPDMTACSIAHDGLPMQRGDTWVVAQDGHLYFENAAVIEALRRRLKPWTEISVRGVPAVQVYRLP